jgi:DNA polymerase type B, organellar and viral
MTKKNHEDQCHDGSVSKWHAWKDSVGMPYAPMMWHNNTISTISGSTLCYCSSLKELINEVSSRKLFVLCKDVLSEADFPFSNALLGAEQSHPYLSRSGGVVALRISQKKRSGFLVPSSTWGMNGTPTKEDLQNIVDVFRLFRFESTTPASLSEKILRSTLPDIISISRPSLILRRDILDNHVGGRIDSARHGQFYAKVYEYDKNKAYLSHARLVPSPYTSPIYCISPSLERALDYPTGYWLCHLRAHKSPIAPIQIDGRYPKEGEAIERWLWTPELRSCVESGYSVEEIERGYGWERMSNFMEEWSDILWEGYMAAENMHPQVRIIIKSMMVGLPGRFLRQPVFHTLIPLSEARARTPGQDDGDIPLMMHIGSDYQPGDRLFSDYALRPEYDRESTALSPIGSYIVMAMRDELYQMMKKEHEQGAKVIRSYIDGYALDRKTAFPENISSNMGMWKEKRYGPSWTEENRFIGMNLDTNEIDIVMPGVPRESNRRLEFLRSFQNRRNRS